MLRSKRSRAAFSALSPYSLVPAAMVRISATALPKNNRLIKLSAQHLLSPVTVLSCLIYLMALSVDATATQSDTKQEAFSMETLRALVELSQDDSNSAYSVHPSYPRDWERRERRLITIYERGVPVMVHSHRYYGATGWDIGMSFSCAPGNKVHYTQMLFAGGDGYDLSPDADLSLRIFPYGGGQTVIPVTLIEALPDARGLIRVHSTFSPTERFFSSLGPTTNFQVQLKENGQSVPYSSGTDFSTFHENVKPVLDACAGIQTSGPASNLAQKEGQSSAPRSPPHSPGVWTPNEHDILLALRAAVEAKMAQIDAFASQCETVGETQNPFAALACIGTGFGSFNSDSMNLDVRSVSLDECVRSQQDFAYCRYTVDADFSGTGLMGELSGLFNTSMAMGGASYGQFSFRDGRWYLERTYERCSWGGEQIRCEWKE
ncbi:hypothetical protein [Halomonas sp. DN3]|uniref:hypothetical protein n=1 Tax=Halomonas sp. DN3 TaxID=2953657 RepID=UPI00209D9E24|nr:hypothetical protein [Halomonas sp. DN3]USZ51703.1 hypothetical protein NKF27_09510 [Halomonas sp. DN3]